MNLRADAFSNRLSKGIERAVLATLVYDLDFVVTSKVHSGGEAELTAGN